MCQGNPIGATRRKQTQHRKNKDPSMYHSIQLPHSVTPINRSFWRRGFRLLPFALAFAWFGLSPTARAVTPPPDGDYPNNNTAEGEEALFSLTTGANNTAIGYEALFSVTTGANNTAIGYEALVNNTTGNYNTATGFNALWVNTTGGSNTANGVQALQGNTTGNSNMANGYHALL